MAKKQARIRRLLFFLLAVISLPVALVGARVVSSAERGVPSAIPDLPFPNNPDPAACGVPTPWGSSETAQLDGHYKGELVEPVVNLYDSHSRREITGQAPTGTEVEIVLFQANPALNYYLVKTVGREPPQEGWVPAPFLRFDE